MLQKKANSISIINHPRMEFIEFLFFHTNGHSKMVVFGNWELNTRTFRWFMMVLQIFALFSQKCRPEFLTLVSFFWGAHCPLPYFVVVRVFKSLSFTFKHGRLPLSRIRTWSWLQYKMKVLLYSWGTESWST